MSAADRLAAAQGGVAGSSLGVDITSTIAAAQAAGQAAALGWAQSAAETPGVGALMPLPQPPSSAGGFGTPRPVVGEGYGVTAAPQPAQGASYGPARPVYAAAAVAGAGYAFGPTAPAVRHVTALGDGRVVVEGASWDPVVFASPADPAPPRTSVLSRLLGWLRGR